MFRHQYLYRYVSMVFISLLLSFYLIYPVFSQPSKGEGQEKNELIPRQLLFGNPEKAAPRLSPSGDYLAYLAPDAQQVLNVWVRELNQPNKQDWVATSDEKRGIRQFIWQLDNQHIIYLQDRDGDENHHVYQTNIFTMKTRDLTPYEGVKAEIVSYDSKHPHDMLVALNQRNPALFDVYRLNLVSGELTLDTENFDNILYWAADHELQVRAASGYQEDGSFVIYSRDNSQSPWHQSLVLDPNEGETKVVGFSEDNQSIYMISSLDHDTARLLSIHLKTGERSVLAEDPQYDLSESLMINPITYQIEAIGVERERLEWIPLDPAIVKDFDHLKQLDKGVFEVVSSDLNNQKWVVASISDQRPTLYYIYERASKQAHFLFSTKPGLEAYTLSSMMPISFTATDGMKLYGYLTLPNGQQATDLPAILFVHGGPWVRDSWGCQPMVQWFANRGYAVLQLNYRGSTGYGKQYVNAGDKEWGGKMHQDLLDGKQWLIDQGYVNPQKVAIYGGSYGGYATLAALAFTPDEFCCGVDIVGPSNLITLLQTIPPYWAPFKALMDRRLGNLERDVEYLTSCSPLHQAAQIKKPLLIGQGANDPRVKQSESDQIVEAMRKNELPVEYLLFLDEGHGFARPENRLKFCAAAEHFLSIHLGGRCEAPSTNENWESLKK